MDCCTTKAGWARRILARARRRRRCGVVDSRDSLPRGHDETESKVCRFAVVSCPQRQIKEAHPPARPERGRSLETLGMSSRTIGPRRKRITVRVAP
jgi:hypothetical protein